MILVPIAADLQLTASRALRINEAALTGESGAAVQHPRLGQVIIEQVAAVRDAGAIILHHHEQYSGHGYPFGLRGSEIPLGARIVAIADTYEATVSNRPSRRAKSHDAASRSSVLTRTSSSTPSSSICSDTCTGTSRRATTRRCSSGRRRSWASGTDGA